MKITVAYCICLGLLAQMVNSFPNTKDAVKTSSRERRRRCPPGPDPTPTINARPCKDMVSNGTVVTPEGEVIECVVPSKEQLLSKLKEIGGANPFYVATTAEEAKNFPNLLPNVSSSDIFICERIKKRRPTGIIFHSKWRKIHAGRRWTQVCHRLNLTMNTSHLKVRRKRSIIANAKVTSATCVSDGTRDPNTGMKLMCNRCQKVRELPSTYFPRYFNTLSCGEGYINGKSSDVCNNFSGECYQKNLYMPILEYKADICTTVASKTKCRPNWVEIDEKIPSCCECQSY